MAMIENTSYKDRPAIAITNGILTATFLPVDGAKLVSLKDANGNEYLSQAKGKTYKRLGLQTSYIEAECSAFDDMFPTVDPCTMNEMEYLDHGEVARREHDVQCLEDAVIFTCSLEALHVVYEKQASFMGEELAIVYKIKNLNSFDFPYVFAGHIMFRGECGAAVVCDLEETAAKEIMFGNPKGKPNLLCEKGTDKEWKYYYNEALSPLNCSVRYPLSRYTVSVNCDSEIIKYLGVWMNPGDLNGMYNIALEPCSALYDSPIKAKETCSYIKAYGTVEFVLKIGIKREENK